jgi:hypothetical protein
MTNTAATKAGDLLVPVSRDWLAELRDTCPDEDQQCGMCGADNRHIKLRADAHEMWCPLRRVFDYLAAPPAEPASAAEGAKLDEYADKIMAGASEHERGIVADLAAIASEPAYYKAPPGSDRKDFWTKAIAGGARSLILRYRKMAMEKEPDPEQSADTRTEKQQFIQRMNYSLWMENQREGCEPPADWQEGYREGKKFAETLQELREASEQSADTPSAEEHARTERRQKAHAERVEIIGQYADTPRDICGRSAELPTDPDDYV